MDSTDVAIIGGGLGGSLAAAMLGRAGIRTTLIDPHRAYPPDFRCEKLDGPQVAILRKTGLADLVLRAATHDGESWVARFGRLIEKRRGDQHGIRYETLVNTMRAAIPGNVAIVCAKATAVNTGALRQDVELSTGDSIPARLVVLATGLNIGLRKTLGVQREVLSACHSISIGFDVRPPAGRTFAFPALTYYADSVADRTALLTLFPIRSTMRANLFVYRDMNDPWLRTLRERPVETLFALMPGLRGITGDFEVDGPVKIRPIDLCVTSGHRQDGIVLVGDAFATSCPAAGTGARRVLTDVERLCNVHIPRWLTTPGMTAEKISAFYDDADKQACDDYSLAKAYSLRQFSIDPAWPWRGRRWAKFLSQYGVGSLRRIHRHLAPGPKSAPGRFPAPEARW